MISLRNLIIMLSALSCATSVQLVRADDEGCPNLRGKDAAAHLEYLRGDRAKLSSNCIVASIRYLGDKHEAQASATLIQYLDYRDPFAVARRGIMLEVYPAINALYSFRKPVVPELVAAIADSETPEVARENAALVILLLCGAHQPDAISVLVNAAHSQTDPTSAIRLMDKARRLAAKCTVENRNECENAVLK
jgi:hypothetical protein